MLPPSSPQANNVEDPSILPGAVGALPKGVTDPDDPKVAAANYRLLGILLGVVVFVLAATYLGRHPLFGVLFHN